MYRDLLLLGLAFVAGASLSAQPAAPLLPSVPADLRVQLVARDPLVRNPCAMAFDARGRLFVGQGPQYRNPKPDTPGDSVLILVDTDGDGIADATRTFAAGLNCIQGLAWHGRDLWIANSPDLTIARDLDGDDVADEFVKVYTDLGNLEHGTHGLNWAPDGRLYFSQGTSKGLTQPGRVAPRAFRELWDVTAPADTPDLPAPRTFTRANHRATYQDPRDNWGREGGVLRCEDGGANLAIIARGMRNPWDIAFDSGFNWLATDNDQSEGDRVIMPFLGAHFGWGHGWSTHWTGQDHLPTVPVSGPLHDGSGTGIVYYDAPHLPPAYRGVWFFNDWLRKATFRYRPRWDGALLQPEGDRWDAIARGGGAGQAVGSYGGKAGNPAYRGALYRPVEILIGPDGALYVSGWGEETDLVMKDGRQANEGRVFRIFWPEAPASTWRDPKRSRPLAQWTPTELSADLGGLLPVWSTDAQDELVRRGAPAQAHLKEILARPDLTEAQQTWAVWTLGRMNAADPWFSGPAQALGVNVRLQAIRIAGGLAGVAPWPRFVAEALDDPEPRLRLAAVLALSEARPAGFVPRLCALAARETDRLVSYATWQALRRLADPEVLRGLLRDPRDGVRRSALLALLEDRALDRAVVQALVPDADPATAALAASWLAKADGNPLIDVQPRAGDFLDRVSVKLTPGVKPAGVRFTLDGSEPTMASRSGSPGTIEETTTLKAALFVNGQKVGNTWTGTYRKRSSSLKLPDLVPVAQATTVAQVHAELPNADPRRGPGLFRAAGCVGCHRVGGEGRAVGPDLTTIGDRDDADSVIRSILMPDQIIVEGYGLMTVSTQDGGAFAGILEGETDRNLRLVQLDGEAVSIPKARITARTSLHQSPMPAFDRVLGPGQLADLVAWLMAQRSSGPAEPATGRQLSSSSRPISDWTWESQPGRLVLSHAGRRVADYVFSDPATRRPHFQNVCAPGGYQITRRHPPASGEPSDHATMHPGVWLAFGDINGEDFWRNKASIEQVRMTREPSVEAGRLTFASENRLLGSDGQELGKLELSFSLQAYGAHAFLLGVEALLGGGGRALVLGDQEEMGLGIRMATELTEKQGGLVVTADGGKGAKVAWGKPAAWAAYARMMDGRTRGAALFPAVRNPGETWWHSRDYGLLVANGFGRRVLPAEADGKVTVPAGGSLRLRYGVLWFDAPEADAVDLKAAYQAWLAARP